MGRGDLGLDRRDLGLDRRDLGLGGRDGLGREAARHGHEPMRPGAPEPSRRPGGRSLANDPIRAGRDALLASLDRPLGSDRRSAADEAPAKPVTPAASDHRGGDNRARGAAALIGRSPFDDDSDTAKEIPAVPSLAVLRPRRNAASAAVGEQSGTDKPRKRLPSWDDVLFGSAPARETS
jgi:hypothetical protein